MADTPDPESTFELLLKRRYMNMKKKAREIPVRYKRNVRCSKTLMTTETIDQPGIYDPM